MSKAIFVGATGQNVGKTTLCLGLMAALKKKYATVGFLKPVGQYHVQVDSCTRVDKDALLFKEYFQLNTTWAHMSPVIIPSGFTRRFLDNEVSEESMLKRIKEAYKETTSRHAYTLVEGTGHVGVGSIINLNNAKVAAELGLDVILIASAGLGSAFDELALNIAMSQQYGVKVKGVILNRVQDDKREMILNYFPKVLKQWGIPLMGCVPFSPFLSHPTMKDFEVLFNTNLLSGHKHHYRRFSHIRLVAGSLDAFRTEATSGELVITPASREDIITEALRRHSKAVGGIILTSRHPPQDSVVKMIQEVDMPVLYAPLCSYDAMKMITSFIGKIRTEDTQKIEQAIKLFESHVDMGVF